MKIEKQLEGRDKSSIILSSEFIYIAEVLEVKRYGWYLFDLGTRFEQKVRKNVGVTKSVRPNICRFSHVCQMNVFGNKVKIITSRKRERETIVSSQVVIWVGQQPKK